MLNYILSSIICETFTKEVGKWQSKKDVPHGMFMSFNVALNWGKEEGFRERHLLLFADANYVGVYTKHRYDVIIGDEKQQGESHWECLGYHDSCWRDCISRFFNEHENRLTTQSPFHYWFLHHFISKELSEELKVARQKR